jgi:DNA-binding NtrC family response regulator
MNEPSPPIIIIVDDDQAMRESLLDYFSRAKLLAKAYASGKKMLSELHKHNVGVVICDLKMPQMSGMEVLDALQSGENSPPLIMITAHGNITTAVEAIKHGAYNFIAKPFNPQDLQKMAELAIEKYHTNLEFRKLNAHPLGNSLGLQDFNTQLLSCANTRDNVLIIGEKGVEKALVAKTLHQHSQFGTKPFVHINCIIISERFFEKHFLEEGNSISRASQGSLFLENLDQLPLESRSKLLELLTDKIAAQVCKSESTLPRFIYSIANPITAEKTHTILNKICTLLNGRKLLVPALREHREDIFELFNHYIAQSAAHYQTSIPTLSEQDIIALSAYDWPGNQQQLKQIAEQFILLNRSVNTSISHLLSVSPTEMIDIGNTFNKNLRGVMQDFEKQLITQAMIECSGNISQVCELLKTPRRTLNEKLLKYDINRSAFLS